MTLLHSIGNFAVSDDVVKAVQKASAETGVSFEYMLAKAAQESGFRADARASTSSATGLYQFIDSTWLEMVHDNGDQFGVGHLADKIEQTDDGRYVVSDSAARQQIMDLRLDPQINALMAGAFTQENRAYLDATVGGSIGETEMYLAHFLGAGGAERFLTAHRSNGQQSAAALFPQAAEANASVFYKSNGQAKSLNEVYAWAESKVDTGMAMAADAGLRGLGETYAVNPATFSGGYSLAGRSGWTSERADTTHLTQGQLGALNGSDMALWTFLTVAELEMPGENPLAVGSQKA